MTQRSTPPWEERPASASAAAATGTAGASSLPAHDAPTSGSSTATLEPGTHPQGGHPVPPATSVEAGAVEPGRKPSLISELTMPLVLLAFATYLLVNMLSMKVPDSVDFPGPRFFPAIITGVIYVLVVFDVVGILRRRAHPADPAIDATGPLEGHPATSGFALSPEAATAAGLTAHEGNGETVPADTLGSQPHHVEFVENETSADQEPSREGHFSWSSLVWVVGGFLAFALLLEFLGWVIGAGLLFWCVARGFGSKRPLMALIVGLTVSSFAYIAFDMLLGLNLPSGILGGGF